MGAALELLDDVGLDALSTRRLATRLDVKSPAIYWHFRNKQDLLDSLAERIYVEGGMGKPLPGERWDEWFVRRAHAYRSALNAHRDGARVAAGSRSASPAMQALFTEELEALCGFGFTPELATHAIAVLSHFISGFVLSEQAAAHGREDNAPIPSGEESTPDLPVSESPTSESVFEHGIRLVITGLANDLKHVGS